jgi:lysophospholipase L1-like esterase
MPVTFKACSGATSGEYADLVEDYVDDNGTFLAGRYGEPGQLSWLRADPNASLVTLTLGGNDTGFETVAEVCASVYLKLGAANFTKTAVEGVAHCDAEFQESVGLVTGHSSKVEQALSKVYSRILADAPHAQLEVVDYPQLLTSRAVSGFCPLTGGFPVPVSSVTPLPVPFKATLYFGFTSAQVNNFDVIEAGLNASIKQALASVASTGRAHLIDVNTPMAAYAQPCNPPGDTKAMGGAEINGIKLALGATAASLHCKVDLLPTATISGVICSPSTDALIATESLHPTALGHRTIAKLVEEALSAQGLNVTTLTPPPTTTTTTATPLRAGAWSFFAPPVPAGVFTASLAGVSCPGPTTCVAVGSSNLGTGPPFAEVFSNGTWVPALLPLPSQDDSASLRGISCPSVGVCVAIGAAANLTQAGQVPIAETLANGTWEATALPLPPSLPAPGGVYMNSVSCPSLGACIAVGWDSRPRKEQGTAGWVIPLIEVLRYGVWTASVGPLPRGATSGEPGSVSCPTVSWCMVVASVQSPPGSGAAMVERFAESSWSARWVTDIGDDSISCASPGNCAAAGLQPSNNESSVSVLAKGKWAYARAAPSYSQWRAVSCPAPSTCVLVGTQIGAEGERIAVLSRGAIGALSNLSPPPSFHGEPTLSGVSCYSAVRCVAVGLALFSSGVILNQDSGEVPVVEATFKPSD